MSSVTVFIFRCKDKRVILFIAFVVFVQCIKSCQ